MDAADNAVAAAWIRLKLCAKWVAQHTSRTSLHGAGTAATRDHHTSSMHSRHVRFLQEKTENTPKLPGIFCLLSCSTHPTDVTEYREIPATVLPTFSSG